MLKFETKISISNIITIGIYLLSVVSFTFVLFARGHKTALEQQQRQRMVIYK